MEQPTAPPEAALSFDVIRADAQDLVVTMRGADVGRFLNDGSIDVEAGVPNPVDAFVRAARLGMFARPDGNLDRSTASVASRQVLPDRSFENDSITVSHVADGAFRVLANMLLSRDLEEVAIRSQFPDTKVVTAERLFLTSLQYPAHVPPPFLVDYEMPDRTARDRVVQLLFDREPSDECLEAAYSGFDAWTLLLMLGGYPRDDQRPSQSGAIPDKAFLVEPDTIEQAFPDVFLCDEDCFASLVNWVTHVHRSGCPVSKLTIR